MKAAPRLGAGIQRTGRLSSHSMAAALAALNRMAALGKQLGAKRRRVVATSAVREASNGGEWLALVRKETGMRVSILDGEDEARLSFLSALAHFDLASKRAIVVDIGGGSLELAMSADGLVERLISLPFGAIRLTEKYFAKGITPAAMRKLRRVVRRDWRRKFPRGTGRVRS
jgi:Exopolyphosphatase